MNARNNNLEGRVVIVYKSGSRRAIGEYQAYTDKVRKQLVTIARMYRRMDTVKAAYVDVRNWQPKYVMMERDAEGPAQ